MQNSQENCKEKIAEISAQSLEIDKLKKALNLAQREIEEKLSELKVLGSQLTRCEEDLKKTNTDLEERKKLIEVRVYLYLHDKVSEVGGCQLSRKYKIEASDLIMQ